MNDESTPGFLDAETLFRHHAPYVARFLARLGVSALDIDDVLQEVFLVVHARGGYVPGKAKPTSYLGAIATRAASSYRRRARVQARRSSVVEPESLTSGGASAARALDMSEAGRALHRAIAELDPTLAATLMLVEFEGESCQSVAAAMGTAVGTVHWRLHKARRLLRRSLAASQRPPHAAARVSAMEGPHGEV